MNLLNIIRKKWLQRRVYKYSLKSQDALSKSEYFLKLSKDYETLALDLEEDFGISGCNEKMKHLCTSLEYAIKSDHFKHLSDIYLDKKLNLETKLCN